MADQNKYYDGTSVSRHLPPGERAFSQVVYESGKPVLDAELNLNQDVQENLQRVLSNQGIPSGWIKGQTRRAASGVDFVFDSPGDPEFVENSFRMQRRTALVGGFPVTVEYANIDTDGYNRIQLDVPPVFGGIAPDVKRSDFVFLEVWQALVSDSPNASATITISTNPTIAGDEFDIAGNTLVATLAAPGVDEFLIGGSDTVTAANIAAAINNSPPNSFTNVTASASGNVVTLRAVVSGVAGNALTVGQSAALGDGAYAFSGATFAGGSDEGNKPSQDQLYRHGNVDSSTTVALDDDLADPIIGIGTARRVQVQYRIRATGQTDAVNWKSNPDGFSDTSIEAQGSQGSTVAGYPFVPADGSTTSGSSDASAYCFTDHGLWIAGDGSSTAATDLGTVDGFVYAIPICWVFRRNDSSAGVGFDPENNANGGLPSTHGGFVSPTVGAVPAGESDRPDGKLVDVIYADDVLDMRKHVVPSGHDLQAELLFQMHSLLDNTLSTWAIDTSDKQDLGSASGDVSTQFLVCNEIGRDGASGGNPAAGSGDTTRGVTIANFDHVRRRFADQPVVERVVLCVSPTDAIGANPGKYVTQANGGYTGWAEDDEIHIDLTTLNASTMGDFNLPGDLASGSVLDFAPPGTTITNLLSIFHDDGNYGVAVDQTVQTKLVEGIGTGHLVITLDENGTQVNEGLPGATNDVVGSGADVGSTRRIFVEVELTYPLGEGPTDTPLYQLSPDTAYTRGPQIENNGATQRPGDWEDIEQARIRDGYREIALEYVANEPGSGEASGTPITDNFVSANTTNVRFLRRVFGSASKLVNVTNAFDATPRAVDTLSTEYGSSSRRVVVAAPFTGAGQSQVDVTYFAQDAVPNAGAAGGGYQVSVYFRTASPQTAGVKAGALDTLPDPLTIEPLVMGYDVWSGTTGKGSVDLPYPFLAPLDQIAMNDGGTASFPGEWYFASTAKISIDDFDAETGLLSLHPLVPLAGSEEFTFQTTAKDAEFRAHYRASDPSTYRPTVFAQGLSSVARHKVFFPFLARATEDSPLWRRNEVVLVVLSRFAELDEENTIRFVTTDNRSAAAIYRTRNLLLIAGD